MRRIFVPKGDEMAGWKTMHNVEHHSLYSSQSIIEE
jgi:hypothetical protein